MRLPCIGTLVLERLQIDRIISQIKLQEVHILVTIKVLLRPFGFHHRASGCVLTGLDLAAVGQACMQLWQPHRHYQRGHIVFVLLTGDNQIGHLDLLMIVPHTLQQLRLYGLRRQLFITVVAAKHSVYLHFP